jgi:hypothetical protein
VGAAYLGSFVDARTPLLVADDHGVRIRLGRSWRGVPWSDVDEVEHQPRRGLLRDGRLVLWAADEEGVLSDLDRSGSRQAAVARKLYGAPLAIPLALTTKVTGAHGDLTAALERLAREPGIVVEPVAEEGADRDEATEEPQADFYEDLADDRAAEPGTEPVEEPLGDPTATGLDSDFGSDEPEEAVMASTPAAGEHDHPVLHDPRPALARGIGFLADRLGVRRDPAGASTGAPRTAPDAQPAEPLAPAASADRPGERSADPVRPPLVASATPLPLREAITGVRAEIRFEGAAALKADPVDDDVDGSTERRLPEARELHRPGSVPLIEDTAVWGDRVRPIAKPGPAVEPLVIEEPALAPAPDPVIGPELVAARTRLGLSVDQLADRTRIRPHVIESIEVDDFAPCGGDFYARGHLRTLARVLGVDVTPLLAAYDDKYADAPIDARRVFEAELATAADGPIRGTRGGPNWSVLVAAVMAVVLAWSIARLVMDSPVELHAKPVLNGSPSSPAKLGPAVPVLLDASSGGAHVVVRDGAGRVVFNGDLAFGDSRTLKAAPPVRVQSSDGALRVSVDGKDQGQLGTDGEPAQNTFAPTS